MDSNVSADLCTVFQFNVLAIFGLHNRQIEAPRHELYDGAGDGRNKIFDLFDFRGQIIHPNDNFVGSGPGILLCYSRSFLCVYFQKSQNIQPNTQPNQNKVQHYLQLRKRFLRRRKRLHVSKSIDANSDRKKFFSFCSQ